MKPEDFKYLDYDYGLRLPRLVLVCNEPSLLMKDDDRQWLKIQHQTAGHACNQHQLLGTVLDPKDAVADAMCALDKKWEGTCTGMGNIVLDDMVAYRQDLHKLFGAPVDCNFSFHELEEGFYPIDYSPQILKKLTDDPFPKELDDLVSWDDMPGNKSFNMFLGGMYRWKIFILGNNCD